MFVLLITEKDMRIAIYPSSMLVSATKKDWQMISNVGKQQAAKRVIA